MTSRAAWAAAGLVSAIVVALTIAIPIYRFGGDAGAYRDAAARIVEGGPLYVPMTADRDPYLYAPWLAWLWVPLLTLPERVAIVGWCAGMLVCTLYALWVVRSPLALVLASLLATAAWSGNAQAATIAVLLWALPRGYGPLAVGAAASLKVFPILYALPWMRRGEWPKALAAVGTMAVLWAPALVYNFAEYPVRHPRGMVLWHHSEPLYPVVVVGMILLAYRLAATRWRWAATSVAVLVSFPRALWYDFGYLLTGFGGDAENEHAKNRRPRPDPLCGARHPEPSSNDRRHQQDAVPGSGERR